MNDKSTINTPQTIPLVFSDPVVLLLRIMLNVPYLMMKGIFTSAFQFII